MKKIEEALLRGDPQDKIYIGEVAEKMYSSAQGDLLRALIKGIQFEQIKRSDFDKVTSSDLKMGRIEGAQMVLDSIEQVIDDKYKEMEPLEEEDN